MIRFLIRLFAIWMVLLLPFILLIRGSVWVHERYDPGAYFSLAGGVLFTFLILVIYGLWIHARLTRAVHSLESLKEKGYFASFMVIGFCIHGLFFMSSANLKGDELKREFRQLHPVVRLAVSTLIFADKHLMITDASRLPEDYRRMGLPSKSSSLHYRQQDGYAYAVDIRTRGYPEYRNVLVRMYFRMMGFQTMRHTGTHDHLHISLPCHFRPGSI